MCNHVITELLNIGLFGPEICPQESYAAVQNARQRTAASGAR